MRYPRLYILVSTLTFLFMVNVPAGSLLAQDTLISPSLIITGEFLGESAPLRDLPAITDAQWQQMVEKAERKMLNPKIKHRAYPYAESALPKGPDPVWQRQMGETRDSHAPLQFIDGTDSPYWPPDANGTIGPNHYMQTINTVYTIYNRAGAIVAGPTNLNTLFYGVTGANYNDGDPIVLYDEQADRWLVAEFSINGTNDYMLIAVSTTNDPTGTWYKYSYDVADVPDYEKFGIWRDGYYMGTNTYGSADIYIFQRSQMLAGLSASAVGWDNPWRPGPSNAFNCVPPLDNDGDFAPDGEPGLFIAFNDDAVGGGNDELWIYELDVDWDNPPNSTFGRIQQIAVSSFDSNFGTTLNNISQQGTSQKLDAIPQLIMNPPQYRNFGSYETILCCHTVDVDNTDHAGIRWYELRRVSSGNWTIRQEGTYAPDGHSRWMGSIMLNGSNEIGLGYSVSSATLYPGIRYCGQSSAAYTAANGILDVSEENIIVGTNYQSTYNRWGDYASMQVDPTDDETFWFTSEYIGTGGQRKTRIANFQVGPVVLTANFATNKANPQAYSTVTLTDVSFGNPDSWSWSITPGTFNYINGTSDTSRHPQVQFTAAGDYSISLTVTNGSYDDTESKTDFIHVMDCGYLYLPFTEDFSDGTLPACWKIIDNIGNGQAWLFNNPMGWNINTTTGTNGVAIIDSYYFGGSTLSADLISPLLDLSDYATVNLYFEHYLPAYVATPPYAAYGRLYYSINDGATWTQLQQWAGTANGTIYNTNLSTQVAGQSRVRFKWNYTGYGYFWAIDDINITGTGPNTWTGTTSTSWSTASNWSANTVPTSSSKVIIPKTATNWPVISGDFSLGSSCDKMTLYGSSQLNINGDVNLTPGKTLAFNGDGVINLTGNWINDSSYLVPGNGTIKFSGTNPSTVTIPASTAIADYQRITFPKSMTPLSTPYNVGPSGNDKSDININIGFTFNYHGTDYSQVQICTNGWISFDQTASTTSDNSILFNTSTPNNIIAPWFDDLNDDNISIILYKLEGTSPNQIFTVEWNSIHTFSTKPGARISFQVKLFETSNVIEFHYGTLTSGDHSASESASIGIEDATGGSGHFIEATTGSTTTGISNLSSETQWPTVNYRFSPPLPDGLQTFRNITVDKTGSSVSFYTDVAIKGNLTIANGTVNGLASPDGIITVEGDWINNGSYAPGSSTVIFNGTSNQNIGGSASTTFTELILDNPAGITLAANQKISDSLTMNAGNIDCGTYTLELGNSVSDVGWLTWTAGNIIGNFKRWIAASTANPVDYPLGTSSSNHKARITFNNNTAGSLTAKFEPGDPGNNSGFPLTDGSETISATDLYTDGSWSLVAAGLTSTNYDLELTGTGFSTAGTPDETVRILKRPDAGGDWIPDGTHVDGSAPIAKRSGLSGFSQFALAKPPGLLKKISGNIKYHNSANTPLLTGVTIKLFLEGSQVGSDFNVTNGTYQFTNLTPGTYELRVSSTNNTAGSVNTTDAAQANFWGAVPYEIEKVRFYAGDVTGGSFFINSTDALKIQDHFVNETAFDKGNWAFWKTGETISSNSNPSESYAQVIMNNSDVVANIYGLCAGDFNLSFTPGLEKSYSSKLELLHTGPIKAGSGQEFELPVKMVHAAEVGAVSLIFNFPDELITIEDVIMSDAGAYFNWAAKGNELRIGWNSINPMVLAPGDDLLKLRLKTTEDFLPGKSAKIRLASNPLNELADNRYEVIDHAVISVDIIEAGSTGIVAQTGENAGLAMSSYPNPFENSATIYYTLPFDGKVSLDINTLLGTKVATLVEGSQTAGSYTLGFDLSGMPAGLYLAQLKLTASGTQKVLKIKILRSQ